MPFFYLRTLIDRVLTSGREQKYPKGKEPWRRAKEYNERLKQQRQKRGGETQAPP